MIIPADFSTMTIGQDFCVAIFHFYKQYLLRKDNGANIEFPTFPESQTLGDVRIDMEELIEHLERDAELINQGE